MSGVHRSSAPLHSAAAVALRGHLKWPSSWCREGDWEQGAHGWGQEGLQPWKVLKARLMLNAHTAAAAPCLP